MLYFFRLLFLLINMDQKTILNWFGIEDPSQQDVHGNMAFGLDLTPQNFEPSPDVSLTTFNLILVGLWEKIQDGLTLADIENILLFILFIRFGILAFRYNLKTSFYITSIGLFAGYLWYRHLIDLVTMYRVVLLKLPFFHKLGIDAIELLSMHRALALTDLKLGENAHWYNPGQVLYYGFTKGITDIDPETGFRYYIDPISMIVSNLKEPTKASIFPLYYKVYHKIIPKIYDVCCKFWNQLSGVAAYAVITRIGKRYCPYLVRWHWTFLLIIGLVEQIFVYFIYRVYHFQTYVLLPKLHPYGETIQHIDVNVAFEVEFLNAVTVCIVLAHITFILFGLFHAICGQYFYVPFFVENTELHIGPRPINSIYSGGQTAWQDPKEKVKNLNRIVPRLWYGWFGRGTDDPKQFVNRFQNFIKKIFQRLKKSFKR